MQPKLLTFGQAPILGKCSECGATVSMVDAQYAGDSALAEHAPVYFKRPSFSTSERNTALKAVGNRSTNLRESTSLNWLGKAYKSPYSNGANHANLICLARPSNLSIQIPYQFMSTSYHRRPCRAEVGCA
jgi:hypothetical protein